MSRHVPVVENMVKCPFCLIFMEDGSRFQTHLMNCERRHPEIKLEICDYNRTHRYRKADAKAHEKTCPDRLNDPSFNKNDFDQAWPSPPKPTTSKNRERSDADDWNDLDSGTYDAKSHAEQKNVIRNHPPFLTKSERRQFGDKEIKRRGVLEREKK